MVNVILASAGGIVTCGISDVFNRLRLNIISADEQANVIAFSNTSWNIDSNVSILKINAAVFEFTILKLACLPVNIIDIR